MVRTKTTYSLLLAALIALVGVVILAFPSPADAQSLNQTKAYQNLQTFVTQLQKQRGKTVSKANKNKWNNTLANRYSTVLNVIAKRHQDRVSTQYAANRNRLDQDKAKIISDINKEKDIAKQARAEKLNRETARHRQAIVRIDEAERRELRSLADHLKNKKEQAERTFTSVQSRVNQRIRPMLAEVNKRVLERKKTVYQRFKKNRYNRRAHRRQGKRYMVRFRRAFNRAWRKNGFAKRQYDAFNRNPEVVDLRTELNKASETLKREHAEADRKYRDDVAAAKRKHQTDRNNEIEANKVALNRIEVDHSKQIHQLDSRQNQLIDQAQNARDAEWNQTMNTLVGRRDNERAAATGLRDQGRAHLQTIKTK